MALRDAADRIYGSPVAIQLRYLQTLARISTNKNHTIVVPIPMEVVRALMQKCRKRKSSDEKRPQD